MRSRSAPRCVFAQEECAADDPGRSDHGLRPLRRDPNYLLGTAPIFDLVPSEGETALFGFIVPTLNIPIQIPVAVRTGSDYGLRFKVSEITQVTPLSAANLTFWGFPAEASHDVRTLPEGIQRASGWVRRLGEHQLPRKPHAGVYRGAPADRQSDCLQWSAADDHAQGADLSGSRTRIGSARQLSRRRQAAKTSSSSRFCTPSRRAARPIRPRVSTSRFSIPNSSASPSPPRRSANRRSFSRPA